MQRYIIRRLIAAIPILLGVSVIAFAILHLMPGDPVTLLVSNFETSNAEQIDVLRAKFGLDRSLIVQFFDFLFKAGRGDLGTSIIKGREVSEMIGGAFFHTMQLAFLALFFAVLVGVPLGIIAAVYHRRWPDSAAIVGSLIGVSMPQFWFAILAILIFSVRYDIFPSSGTGGFHFLLLPAIVLGTRAAAAIARLTRSSMLDVLGAQYIVTARAKGLRSLAVVGKHGLRNALIPVVTLVGLQLGRLLGGTVVIEAIFNRQGLGKLVIDSILDKDIPVLQGTILVVALTYLLLNILVDISYAWLDPRIRYS